jgi:hypothetical protein
MGLPTDISLAVGTSTLSRRTNVLDATALLPLPSRQSLPIPINAYISTRRSSSFDLLISIAKHHGSISSSSYELSVRQNITLRRCDTRKQWHESNDAIPSESYSTTFSTSILGRRRCYKKREHFSECLNFQEWQWWSQTTMSTNPEAIIFCIQNYDHQWELQAPQSHHKQRC